MTAIHRTGPVDIIWVNVTLTSTVPTNTIVPGDLLANVTNFAIKAADFTWDTNIATTQALFVAAFLGVSMGTSIAASTDSKQTQVPVNMDGTFEFDCTSATYYVDDLVGPAKNPSADKMTNNLVAVATDSLAVAVVVKDSGASATRITARLLNTPVKR